MNQKNKFKDRHFAIKLVSCLPFLVVLILIPHPALSQEKLMGLMHRSGDATCHDPDLGSTIASCSAEIRANRITDDGSPPSEFLFTSSKYGTVSLASAPRISAAKIDLSQDIVEQLYEFLRNESEAFGVTAPESELSVKRVTFLAHGAAIAVFQQVRGDKRVIGAGLSVLVSRFGDIIWAQSSLVPTEIVFDAALDSSFEHECAYDGGLAEEEVFFETSKYLPHSGALLTKGLLVRERRGDSIIERLIDVENCSLVDLRLLTPDGDGPYYGVTDDQLEIEDCINSSFPSDTCGVGNTWPEDYQENLWDFLHDVHDKSLVFAQWEDWEMCRKHGPDPEDILLYDNGLFGQSLPIGTYRAAAIPCIEYGSSGPVGYAGHMEIEERKTCLDTVGHEATHLIHYVTENFNTQTIRTMTLREEIADIIGELFEDEPDWENKSSPCFWQPGWGGKRSLQAPLAHDHPDSYRSFLACEYSIEARYRNIGILANSAWLLGHEGLSGTKYGVTVYSLGLQNARELFWDYLLSAPSYLTYESSASLLAQLAYSRWGWNSWGHVQTVNAMDAVGIWREPSIISYMVYMPPRYWYYIPRAQHSPAAAVRDESSEEVRYLFYKDYSTNPYYITDICYLHGDSYSWTGEVCLGSVDTDKRVEAISNPYDSNIYVYYIDGGTTTAKYFYLDQSRNVVGPYNLGFSTDRKIEAVDVDSGTMLFYRDYVTETAKWKYVPNGIGLVRWGDAPSLSGNGDPPSVVFDSDNDLVWALWTDSSGRVKLANAATSCLLSVRPPPNCWSSTTQAPAPQDNSTASCSMDFPLHQLGSPASAVHQKGAYLPQLYISFAAEDTYSSLAGLWTDSCHNFCEGSSACSDGLDRKLPLASNDGDWELTVPRIIDTPAVDTGELHSTGEELLMFSANEDGYIYETKQVCY